MAQLTACWVLLLAGTALLRPCLAQTPLYLVDNNTTVRSVDVAFDSTSTFEEDRLLEHVATTGPSFFDRVKKILPFTEPAPHPFNPLELLRDVVRLRQFYHDHGFLEPMITYRQSRLDTARNAIRVIFSIAEGPPALIDSLFFFGIDGKDFPDSTMRSWQNFRREITIREGSRYSKPLQLQTREETLSWLRDRGYAFAQVQDTVFIDSTAHRARLRFDVDPGPLGYFNEIVVEGNQSVTQQIIKRELPFTTGQVFSGKKLSQGQRELFALNLFRLALTDLPSQPRDSTVEVLVRVREARPQLLTYEAGYGAETGVTLQTGWTHRNFLGDARTFSTDLNLNTGIGASPSGGRTSNRLARLSATLRQPYLFSTRFSGSLSPFIQYERDQQLEEVDLPFGFNSRELGLNTTLLYEILPFRTVSAQHTLSRVLLRSPVRADTVRTRDPFSKSILTLSGNFGRQDNQLNPTEGFWIRPSFEMAGRILWSDVQYYKLQTDATGYLPLTKNLGLAGRLVAGRLWPVGKSSNQEDPRTENRFDDTRFYAGGNSDLRGWSPRLAGPKITREDVVGSDTLYSYEAVGGLSKLGANAELRLPFPGLGPKWGTAVFVEAAYLGDVGFGLSEKVRMGTGAGVNYQTLVGFIRLDVAYKINPDARDLRDPEDFFRLGEAAKTDWKRRFGLHLSIGRAF